MRTKEILSTLRHSEYVPSCIRDIKEGTIALTRVLADAADHIEEQATTISSLRRQLSLYKEDMPCRANALILTEKLVDTVARQKRKIAKLETSLLAK